MRVKDIAETLCEESRVQVRQRISSRKALNSNDRKKSKEAI